MIHVITTGCSFSENLNIKYTSKELYPQIYFDDDWIGRYTNFLILDFMRNDIEFEIFNEGRGSAGNHIIKQISKLKVNELLEQGIPPKKIYLTVQLSGLSRPSFISNQFKDIINITDEWKYDYYNFQEIKNIDNLKFIYQKHIENIDSIIKFIKETKINGKIFWGWETLTPNLLDYYDLKEKYERLDSNILRNFETNLPRKKRGCTLDHADLLDYDEYIKYGGMVEVSDTFKKENEIINISPTDCHLNSKGYALFYEHFYKKIFQEWNIL